MIIAEILLYDFIKILRFCFYFKIQLVEKQQDEGLDGGLDYVALENGFVRSSLSLSISSFPSYTTYA